MKNAVIVVLILAVIGGGAFALSQNKNDETENQAGQTNTSQEQISDNTETSVTTTNNSTSVTITYSESGFGDPKITVPAGANITVKNTSSRTVDFASDEHPTHRINSELNVGDIGPGESKTFTVSRKGTFGFHNHLNVSETGTITVQ